MPIYEYQCAKCQKVHEVVQKFSDPRLTECPECQGELTKLMSLTSFSLKGTGWYTTDYKRAPAPVSKANSETKPQGTDTATVSAASSQSSAPASGAASTGTAPAAASSPSPSGAST